LLFVLDLTGITDHHQGQIWFTKLTKSRDSNWWKWFDITQLPQWTRR